MNEQLLKMNGLSLEILDALSYESQLGISFKKNYPLSIGLSIRNKYEQGLILNESDFQEVFKDVLLSC